MRRYLGAFLVALTLLAYLAGSGIAAETISAVFRLAGARMPVIHVTSHGLTSVALGEDQIKHASKRAFVRTLTFEDYVTSCELLVRVEADAKGQLWLDVVGARTIGELTTRVAAMSLGSVAVGHPSPANDLVDTSALTDASD